MKKNILTIILIISIFFLNGCNNQKQLPISNTGFYFDTVVSITIYDSADYDILNSCFDVCERMENLFSLTDKESDVWKINHSNGKSVKVSDETIELIQKGIYYSELSNGSFDITIAPLSELWNLKEDPFRLPTDQQIAEALSHVNYQNVVIDGNFVKLNDPQSAIDLGGIAKGYIADKIKSFLIENNIEHALINLGGNVLAIGGKSEYENFSIGIQKPFKKTGETIHTVSLNDTSVVTSGCYERYKKIEGDNTLYHHILSTQTGKPCENNLYSVTILSDSSLDGDALSTVCFVLGVENSRLLLDKLDNVDAIFVTDQYEIIDTRETN